MLLDFLQDALTLLTAPRKRHFLASQAKQILQNRQQSTVTMSTHVQEPPSKKESNVLNKDTGFPEPLSMDRNTTLPHPDADTSKNATIEAPDFDLVRTHSRRSLLGHRRQHSSRSNKGLISPTNISVESSGLYDNIEYADRSKEHKSPKEIQQEIQQREDLAAPPKDHEVKEVGDARRTSTRGTSSESDDSILMAKEARDDQGYKNGERKKGVLRKLGLHKV